jgi:DNA topoisomerase VI subunit B
MASDRNSQAKITASSTAEYFARNLQQVGFSSPTKAVLTTLKESLDNSLDACEDSKILPEIFVVIKKLGKGTLKNTDKILVRVEDNGPGIELKYIPMVFGQYLASSKFGQGRCSRGQQGIGISAATTWAVQTSASGAKVITKCKGQKKALSCLVVTDLKKNKGVLKDKTNVEWKRETGTSVEFTIDGRIQINGEGGVLSYLRGSALLNPHMTIHYEIADQELVTIKRVVQESPIIPPSTQPHPHTMKLGEFISYARFFGRKRIKDWLLNEFSKISEKHLNSIIKASSLKKTDMNKTLSSFTADNFKQLYSVLQEAELPDPSTKSVMSIGEKSLSLSILRLGEIDYFSVVTRKAIICDYKPIQVEIALARLKSKRSENDASVQVLRFANRVPLQFDKSSCAIVKAITSINWKSYGLKQSKSSLPSGPYIFAVSVVSPFIKFKNASKETVDASEDLIIELRKALMKGGQGLSRHLKRENKVQQIESRLQHIEKFSPILVESLCRVISASAARKAKANKGLEKILSRDNIAVHKQLNEFEEKLKVSIADQSQYIQQFQKLDEQEDESDLISNDQDDDIFSKKKKKRSK